MRPNITVAEVRRAIEKAGGTMEEDEGLRDMRTLQACAPDGKVWAEGVHCMRIDWATGNTPHAAAHRADTLRDLKERLADGLIDDPDCEPNEANEQESK